MEQRKKRVEEMIVVMEMTEASVEVSVEVNVMMSDVEVGVEMGVEMEVGVDVRVTSGQERVRSDGEHLSVPQGLPSDAGGSMLDVVGCQLQPCTPYRRMRMEPSVQSSSSHCMISSPAYWVALDCDEVQG